MMKESGQLTRVHPIRLPSMLKTLDIVHRLVMRHQARSKYPTDPICRYVIAAG